MVESPYICVIMYKNPVLKVAAVTPRVWLADPVKNSEEIIRCVREAAASGSDIVVFPEMCLTGATCGDLFRQELLLEAARRAALEVAKATAGLDITIVLGLPVGSADGYSSGAAVLRGGKFLEEDPRFLVVTGEAIPPSLPEGTELVLHLAASPELVTRQASRKRALAALTYRTGASYVYCAAGYGESTGDAVYAGPSLI